MIDLPFSLNSEPVKYTLIALASPIWLPFMKALWKEFNDSLRDEGGVLGFAPTRKELEALNRKHGRHASTLVSETWEEYYAGRARPRPTRGPAARQEPPRARGFR